MHELPTDGAALIALVFALGLRHGFDADHLAAVDGLTRLNAPRRAARWCGVLFSLGHGAVVVAVAGAVALSRAHWQAPAWLDLTGTLVSVALLALLGVVNLHAVISAPRGTPVPPVGIKGRLLGRLMRAHHPLAVAGVGALFALSFDTLSQAALFAVVAAPSAGVGGAVALGALFMTGMLLTDGLNGWWVARLIGRTDARAAGASRVMGAAIGLVSLLTAAWCLAQVWIGDEVPGWVAGAVVLIVTIAGYAAATGLARRTRRRRASAGLASA